MQSWNLKWDPEAYKKQLLEIEKKESAGNRIISLKLRCKAITMQKKLVCEVDILVENDGYRDIELAKLNFAIAAMSI